MGEGSLRWRLSRARSGRCRSTQIWSPGTGAPSRWADAAFRFVLLRPSSNGLPALLVYVFRKRASACDRALGNNRPDGQRDGRVTKRSGEPRRRKGSLASVCCANVGYRELDHPSTSRGSGSRTPSASRESFHGYARAGPGLMRGSAGSWIHQSATRYRAPCHRPGVRRNTHGRDTE